jgi:hypothetical protein
MDEWGPLLALALGAIVFGSIANNRRLNPRVRLVARTAQGDLVQDLETGLIHLLV